jgi:tetratricopeptide (TPR) repeat protein
LAGSGLGEQMGGGKSNLPDFDKLWDYDHPEVSEKRFRDLLPVALDSRDVSYFSQLLTQIARAEGLQRKFENAHKTLDRVDKAMLKINDRTRIRYLLERGRVYNSSGKPESAKPLFQEAFDLSVLLKEDFYAVDAAHMIAIVEDPERQMEWNLKALDMAENSIDDRARNWRASLCNNTGWTYFDRGNYEEALYMFEKALRLREEQGNPDNIRIAKWCVAKALRMKGHTDEAMEIQQELFQDYQSAGRKSGFVYEEIAECLLAMQREDEAQGWFAAAYEELRKDPSVASDRDRLVRMKTLGRVGIAGPA